MQRALIVDDSKTAQLRLKKMMARYNLTVDVAFSAEEALGYLSYRMPSVIFMDHHMEGMDGFEALKIIKANPNTAMIPVIMYTAQKGDVYVGQARALGALDILSKEVIKPSNLERVLSGLKIYPKDKQEAVAVPVRAAANAGSPPPAPEMPEPEPTPIKKRSDLKLEEDALAQIRSQVARLFELHIADVRQQISDNSRYIVRRLTSEIEKMESKEPTVGDVPLSVMNAEISEDNRRSNLISGTLLFLILAGLALLAYQLFETRKNLDTLGEHYLEITQSNNRNRELISKLSAQISYQTPINTAPVATSDSGIDHGLIAALSWALDTNLQFDFDSQPLNEQLMLKVSNLVYRLASTGFEGVVELHLHFGNFCLLPSDGDMELAAPDTPADQCLFSADVIQDYPVGNYLSIPYSNFQDTAVPVKEGLIDLNVITEGVDSPRELYPQNLQNVTAGEWNAIASKNNRVAIDFNFL